jgi:hypothetical protein
MKTANSSLTCLPEVLKRRKIQQKGYLEKVALLFCIHSFLCPLAIIMAMKKQPHHFTDEAASLE